MSGKNFKDENFPVASFVISKNIKEFIRLFYSFARTADDIADHESISKTEKLRVLNFFDHSLKNRIPTKVRVLNDLLLQFEEIIFAKKYSRNLLKAFKIDATKRRYNNWAELIYYCKFSANPVGRFFIDLTYCKKNKEIEEKIKILKSSDNLCTALQIINHIQDCKEDYEKLDRVYLPISYFNKYNINVNSLKRNHSCENFEKLKKEIIGKVENLLENAKVGLKLIEIWRLKKETLIILNIAKRLCFLLKSNDPLEKKIKLTRIDLIFCFIKGIICD